MDIDEVNIIKQAQSGDSEAFEQLYDLYQQPVFSYIFYRVGDQQLAEDLTGDVFVKMVTKIQTFQPGGRPFLAWLYTVAGNQVRDHVRREKRLTWLPLNETDSDGEDGLMTKIGRRLKQEQLIAALDELTDEQRQVIVLRFIEGEPSAAVAKKLGKSLTGVKALQRRAIGALRRLLEQEGAYV